jgi:putative DNA primase/helicase
MIEGCTEWQQFGLNPPAVVTGATEDYFKAQDFYGRWLEECCILAAGLEFAPSILPRNFHAWCQKNGEEFTDNRGLRDILERTEGVRYVTIRGKQLVRGIGLKPPPDRRQDTQ